MPQRRVCTYMSYLRASPLMFQNINKSKRGCQCRTTSFFRQCECIRAAQVKADSARAAAVEMSEGDSRGQGARV